MFHLSHHLPFPEQFQLTTVSENDLNLFRQAWGGIENRFFFGDKIYHDSPYFHDVANILNSIMLTPAKGINDQPQVLKQKG